MTKDSRMNLKMLFAILTDKEIKELKERAIRQRNFYAANLLRWEADERSQPIAKPVQSPFVRCKEARSIRSPITSYQSPLTAAPTARNGFFFLPREEFPNQIGTAVEPRHLRYFIAVADGSVSAKPPNLDEYSTEVCLLLCRSRTAIVRQSWRRWRAMQSFRDTSHCSLRSAHTGAKTNEGKVFKAGKTGTIVPFLT
jgi:hypothetical protein